MKLIEIFNLIFYGVMVAFFGFNFALEWNIHNDILAAIFLLFVIISAIFFVLQIWVRD